MPLHRSAVSLMLLLFAIGSASAQQGKSLAESRAAKYPPLPGDVERSSATIWSDGTRMAGDVYRPKDLKPTDKLPAIVFVHGTGGVKKTPFSIQLATAFARHGYIFLNFDYRGWGESESRLLMLEPMPEPDAKGELTVKARAVRWQMDFQDQTTDVRNAIAFLSGEPNVDRERIGIFGTSYGGSLVTWTAAHDPRVKCAAMQVPGLGGIRGVPYSEYAYGLMTRQARGETEPVPYEHGAPGGKMAAYSHMRYNVAKDVAFDAFQAARQVKIPTLIIDAGSEELMDITKNGGRVAEILKANGTPVSYHVIPGIGHYGVYVEKLQEVLKVELDWFDGHLKPAAPDRPKGDRDRDTTRSNPDARDKSMSGKQSLHRVNGVDINVVESGQGNPAIVFLHYWGGSSRTWGPVMEGLSKGSRCIAIDFRGWGRSSKEAKDYGLETLADDVAGIVDELGLKEFLIVGHSMGGKVAQLVAARRPAGLKGLILVAPAPPTPLDVPEERRRGYIALYQTREGAETVIGNMTPARLPDAYREQIIEDTLCGSPGAKHAWPEEGMIQDISEKSSKITVPVRVVVGAADKVETEASLRVAFGKVIPGAEFVVLPGVGHMAPLEATAEVVNAIRSAKVN